MERLDRIEQRFNALNLQIGDRLIEKLDKIEPRLNASDCRTGRNRNEFRAGDRRSSIIGEWMLTKTETNWANITNQGVTFLTDHLQPLQNPWVVCLMFPAEMCRLWGSSTGKYPICSCILQGSFCYIFPFILSFYRFHGLVIETEQLACILEFRLHFTPYLLQIHIFRPHTFAFIHSYLFVLL